MIFEVSHRTTYKYARNVSIAQHVLHLTPRRTERQAIRRFDLEITPPPAMHRQDRDFFGNDYDFVMLEEEHKSFVVEARCRVEVEARPELDPAGTPTIGEVRALSATDRSEETLAVRPFVFDSPSIRCPEELIAWAAPTLAADRPVLAAAIELNHRIHTEFKYDSRATTVGTTVAECLEMKRGVCQDFAHLMIAAMRGVGVPARYVSGYLRTYPPPGQPRLIGADASHAWVQVWVPRHQWVDLDPTNDSLPGDEHITLAYGRDYSDVSPVNGVIFGGGSHSVAVAVDVAPEGE